jgi:SAM-dependent methyltransferase
LGIKGPGRQLRNARERLISGRRTSGEVTIYNEELRCLSELGTDSVDAVVAVSALEHNDPTALPLVVSELTRVLKPGGRLIATLGAAKREDWFHEPSRGWNYSARTIIRLFDLERATPTNYDDYDRLIAQLRSCAELRDNLAEFYSRSGSNGMPWGKWDPQYQPVGVLKTKAMNVA